MTRPVSCPNCGHKFPLTDEAVMPVEKNNGDKGYDCYCKYCKWSGDIFPDDEVKQ